MESFDLGISKLSKKIDLMFEATARYEVPFILSPSNLQKSLGAITELSNWKTIKYDDANEIKKIPDDKKGVYAFIVKSSSDVLPLHGYVLYIGAAGVRSKDGNLRKRYRQGYRTLAEVEKRPTILRMIYDWKEVLYFSFASVSSSISGTKLGEIEENLNTVLAPPFSINDIDTVIKEGRKAFR